MTTAHLDLTIQQGATFAPKWQRLTCAYDVKYMNGRLVDARTGKAVPDADLHPVDYTGCTAFMQLRCGLGAPVLLEFSTAPTTEQGGITLTTDGWMQLHLTPEQTAALPYGREDGQWERAIGHLEVTYPDGTVLRECEIHFCLSPEVTRHA